MRKMLCLLLLLAVVAVVIAPEVAKAQTCFTLNSVKNNNHGVLVRRPSPNCGGSTYTESSNVEVRAVPNAGFTCLGWAQCDGTESTAIATNGGTICICSLVMDANKTASATFN